MDATYIYVCLWEYVLPQKYFTKMHISIYKNLKDVAVYIDDFIVWGKTEKEHEERLHSALEKLAHIGLHQNVEKCMFKQRQINYLGELITENGVYPDPEKVHSRD